MDRKQLFDYIISHNLKDEVKQKFGKPYNSVSTELLDKFVAVIEEANNCRGCKPCNNVSTGRKGLYEYIKANKLQDLIKAKYGKNFTQVSTEQLIETCKDFGKPSKQPLEIDEDCLKKVGKKADISSSSDCIDSAARKVLKALCITVNRRDLLNQLN
jgi:hypothetical protein